MELTQDAQVLEAAKDLIAVYSDKRSSAQMRNVVRVRMQLYLELAQSEQAEKLKEGVL